MKTSTKRILSIGLAGLLLVGTLVVYVSFIKPEIDVIAQERSLAVSKANLFSDQKAAVQGVQKLIAQFQSITSIQQDVNLEMPIGANTTQALNQIQSVTRLNQVNLNSLSIKAESFLPSRQPLAKRLGTLTVNMAVTGAYDNIKGFLRALETNVRVANTKTFTISPVSGLNQNNYSLTLSVEIYYQEGS
ncbi:MAG: hypothetical protein UY23_C0001G0281 [Candidatus Jorgensenbacteria bacterium GW2011_GWA1_48_11]|uniref:Pilus assembly protein, PilO n=1 Tax=Candidatus Jorgensenbacteria bacterium GW2011_GWA1_48_11 TaxID=1618660 RepID=A0A0G1XBK1_9BACT|nr:MAG: hypothetical protein UY23_C0001G0281 [Candidatus Jorgensenbacteria bacterium GW2011_GWA1_48_11]KKW12166.1 MAG: hypothetical protein UY51_C0005G0408 [Candidatus Jorgensenbacteria bacterium GW2011_GWB1_49_9]